MSDPTTHPEPGAEPRIERRLPWISAFSSVLLHVLLLLILLWGASRPVVTPPQGASSGGRVKVDFVGEPAQTAQPAPVQPRPTPEQAATPPSPAQSRPRPDPGKPVREAKFILPPEPSAAQPHARPQAATETPAQASPASSPAPAQRRPQTWTGRPPGLLEESTSDDDGLSRGSVNRHGNHNDVAPGEPSMEVGGFQIVYDLVAEQRLRTWMEQGMKELSIPLPGTRFWMVCPAETALRRESGKCRLLDPTDPEMEGIGDARQVVSVMSVYRRGELVWRGPGPYR